MHSRYNSRLEGQLFIAFADIGRCPAPSADAAIVEKWPNATARGAAAALGPVSNAKWVNPISINHH